MSSLEFGLNVRGMGSVGGSEDDGGRTREWGMRNSADGSERDAMREVKMLEWSMHVWDGFGNTGTNEDIEELGREKKIVVTNMGENDLAGNRNSGERSSP